MRQGDYKIAESISSSNIKKFVKPDVLIWHICCFKRRNLIYIKSYAINAIKCCQLAHFKYLQLLLILILHILIILKQAIKVHLTTWSMMTKYISFGNFNFCSSFKLLERPRLHVQNYEANCLENWNSLYNVFLTKVKV